MQQSISYKHCWRKRIRSRGCWPTLRPWGWLKRTGGRTTLPPYVMYVKSCLRETLSVTIVTSRGNSGGQPTIPATSNCGSTARWPPSLWSFITCGGTTATCWCKQSQRWRAKWTASPTTQRSTSASPLGRCASSTAPSSCWLPLTSWYPQTSPRPSRSQHSMSLTRLDATYSCARVYTLRVHGLLGALCRAKTPPEGGLLLQASQWGHQRRGLHTCAKSLGDLRVRLSGGLQQPLLQDRSAFMAIECTFVLQ